MSVLGNWDVYRDEDGNPVTITEQQMHAIWHAINVVQDVRAKEGYPSIGKHGNWHADLYKSRLLGRMLIDGRPPLPGPASQLPHEAGAVAYWALEGDGRHPGPYLVVAAFPPRVELPEEQ